VRGQRLVTRSAEAQVVWLDKQVRGPWPSDGPVEHVGCADTDLNFIGTKT